MVYLFFKRWGVGLKKEVISFRKVIEPNKTDVIAERVKSDGTIEEIKVRFYPGQEKALQVVPFVEHKGQQIEQLISFPNTTDHYLSGDNDYFIYDISVPVEYDDFLKVEAKNTSVDFSYTLVVDIVIDYLGGKNRA